MSKDNDIVMELITKVFMARLTDIPDISKKTMKIQLQHDVETIADLLQVQFKVMADKLVDEKQVCNVCGNEIHFEKYATYPNANIKMPKNFGKPAMLEQVWQYNPKEDIDDDQT